MPKKPPVPLDKIPLTDRLVTQVSPTVEDYVRGVSEYYRRSGELDLNEKKRAQLVLGSALGRAAAHDLRARLPGLKLKSGETAVAGALRAVRADVCEFHPLDGLRLALEIKPVNLSVGRAIWNRFGDIRTFAVNLHIKFPFAVIGGVLAIPTVEYKDGRELRTEHLIERATQRLIRGAGRRSEGDPTHLLEGVALLAYDPHSSAVSATLPAPGSGLRWTEFIDALVTAYVARFEGVEEAISDATEDQSDA